MVYLSIRSCCYDYIYNYQLNNILKHLNPKIGPSVLCFRNSTERASVLETRKSDFLIFSYPVITSAKSALFSFLHGHNIADSGCMSL
jgi:ketopantoate reductase